MLSHRRTLPAPEGLAGQETGYRLSGDKKDNAHGAPTRDTTASSTHGAVTSRETQTITVLLLDDMPLTRECLSLSINICDRGVRVLTATSLPTALQLLQGESRPDVLLCNLSTLHPADAEDPSRLQTVVEAVGRTPLILLSDREDGHSVFEAFRLGVRGYISTTVELSVALEAIRLVAAGGAFVPANFLHKLMKDVGTSPDRNVPGETRLSPSGDLGTPTTDNPLSGLTPRQRSVLKCMSEGKPNKIIAHELGMRESTVKVHVRSILKKLGATNRTEAVYRTMRETE